MFPTVIFHFSEELLIDFRELIGEHSGKNMAAELRGTLETYGLQGKVGVNIAM